MARERSLGWVVLTAVLVAPVVVYQYLPRASAPTPAIRPDLVREKDRFPAPRADGEKIVPAPPPIEVKKEAEPPVEPPYAEPANEPKPAEPPPAPEPARDPTLSPYDVLRLAQLEHPAPGDVPVFIPHTPPPKPEEKLSVEAIIAVEKARPQAIVNGETVGVGEKVGKATVIKIGEDTVTFRSRGKTVVKHLGD